MQLPLNKCHTIIIISSVIKNVSAMAEINSDKVTSESNGLSWVMGGTGLRTGKK